MFSLMEFIGIKEAEFISKKNPENMGETVVLEQQLTLFPVQWLILKYHSIAWLFRYETLAELRNLDFLIVMQRIRSKIMANDK